jgi:competence protein ComGC
MKELIILLVIVVLLLLAVGSCSYKQQRKQAEKGAYAVAVVEGCQYLMCPSYYGYFVLSHKGNCTNSIHIYRAEDGK